MAMCTFLPAVAALLAWSVADHLEWDQFHNISVQGTLSFFPTSDVHCIGGSCTAHHMLLSTGRS